MTLNKKMLCDRFREITSCTHADAHFVVSALTNIMIEELCKDNRVMLGSIGTFSIVHRKQRFSFNPQTKDKMTIPARPALKITPSKMMKQLLIQSIKSK